MRLHLFWIGSKTTFSHFPMTAIKQVHMILYGNICNQKEQLSG